MQRRLPDRKVEVATGLFGGLPEAVKSWAESTADAVIVNRETFNSVRLGLELASTLQRLYPGKLDLEACRRSIGNRKVIDELKAGVDPGTIEEYMLDDLAAFEARVKPFLLY